MYITPFCSVAYFWGGGGQGQHPVFNSCVPCHWPKIVTQNYTWGNVSTISPTQNVCFVCVGSLGWGGSKLQNTDHFGLEMLSLIIKMSQSVIISI